ncbi:hypothetical protein [Flavicella sp.]|uniref:hypothetical protein n=1 Tax=Flavicella sp. TaxID=2957742 RepID=UPI003015E01E
MKKILGILGVAIFALTFFINTNVETDKDISLSSIIASNTANAEGIQVNGCEFLYFQMCKATFVNVTNCHNVWNGSNCGI